MSEQKPRGSDYERWEVLGKSVEILDHVISRHWRGEIELVGFSVRVPPGPDDEILIVFRGLDGAGTPIVAFHSDLSISGALAGGANRLRSGNLRWKEDGYRTKS